MAASRPPSRAHQQARSNKLAPSRTEMNPIGADHASLLTPKPQRRARQSGGYALGTPTVAAGSNGRVGHVLPLALVAHRRSDGRNSNLAVATIKALHLRLGLGWGFSVCWHLRPPR